MSSILKTLAVSAAAMSLCTVASQAQEASLEGQWEGDLVAGATVLSLILDLEQSDEGLEGVMISVNQGNAEIPVDDITEVDGQYTILMNSVGARYVARLEDEELSGNFYQAGMSMSLSMTKLESSD